MSLFSPEVEPPPTRPQITPERRAAYRSLGRSVLVSAMKVVRALVGIALCAHQVGAVVVVGWTFRLMRLRILRGLWITRRIGDETFAEFAERHWADAPRGATPRFFASEHWRERVARPTNSGRTPSFLRRGYRALTGLFGAFARNAWWGVLATLATFALTGPGLLLIWGAWEYGWNNSFHKGYELAFVGPFAGALGMAMFAAAMFHVPMAWAHMAACGDPRAFFHRRVVARLARAKLAAMTLYALAFALLTLPATAMWCARAFVTQIDPTLEAATPSEITAFCTQYAQWCAVYLFLAFVASHLLIAKIYRSALIATLARDPSFASELPPRLAVMLAALGYVPDAAPGPRGTVARIVLGTGGRAFRVGLWVASVLLWGSVAAQLFLDEFFVYHEYLAWLNPPLIHLPSLYLGPRT